jgi:NADPH-dependent 2,4-dienoyl-CoA reductase/sulfur reductase-like enzyme
MEAQYVLIGNSAATLAAIDWIRKYDRDGTIILINREPGPAYSRVALPYYVAGEMSLDELLIRRTPDYERQGVQLVDNATVGSIDAGAEQVVLSDGRKIRYHRLLIGTGSTCSTPPIKGLGTINAHYLWTLDDAKGMRAAAEKARTAVVIGGGFIGMLAAEALRKLNIRLTIVEMTPQLLPQLLDPEGGKLFGRAVQDEGVTLRLGTRVEAVAPQDGQIAVTLASGETIATDMVAVAAGVKPNLSCVERGPCKINRGIVVDERLRTDCAGIYAAGDVAEVKDFLSEERVLHAIWPTAVEQGRIAGAAMAGAKVTYPGSLGMNVVELFNVTLAQVGRFKEAATDDVKLLGAGQGSLYRKLVVGPNGDIVGAMYLGDENGVAEMGVIHGMIRRRAKWREFTPGAQAKFSYATLVRAAARR